MHPDLVAAVAPLIQAQEEGPTMSTVIQAIWLGMLIMFVFSVFAAGFTAKKIENLHAPTYSKAVLATLLKNMLALAGFAIFGVFLQAPVIVTWIIVAGLIPIFVYKMVFSAPMWREAALIWIVALIVEVGVGYVLVLVGLLSLAAFQGGT